MSKQSEAKQAQGYKPNHFYPVCMNCKYSDSVVIETDDSWSWNIKKETRCGIGGFAVKKMGTCKLYERKD